ncbi:hypothetical protein [Paenibacillus peoriae]|uniref:hypothetical protein n=1 Tax=Paenibacillus peoriae TaxID=59893 RepID=UPI0030D37A41
MDVSTWCSSRKAETKKGGISNSYYRETYRPQFHYSPEKNWMNNSNGLVYHEGEYHLFYQHTPHDTRPDFGRMYWGELPPTILPGEDGASFSGSAVVDKNSTS